jgi:hypothetical protein
MENFPNMLNAEGGHECPNCKQATDYGLMIDNREDIGQFCSVFCAVEWARENAVSIVYIRYQGRLLHAYDFYLYETCRAGYAMYQMREVFYAAFEGAES